jgi:hypothetical protein
MVVAVPARMRPDRDPLETMLLLEYPPFRLRAVADEIFHGRENAE